jgi:signal transduction histidine kinase/ligand-binding sensor domain-containing protein/DNA-binding response OmpR family regulator
MLIGKKNHEKIGARLETGSRRRCGPPTKEFECGRNRACMRLFVKMVVLMAFLWINGGVFAQPEVNRIIKRYGIKDGLSQAVVNSITQDEKGFMWFATDDGLNRFDGYEFRSFKFDTDSDSDVPFQDNFVQRIFKDSRGRLWVSSRRGLYRFDLSSEKMKRFHDGRRGVTNDVSFISESSSQKLWIAWYLSGVGVFDPVKERYDTTRVHGLSENATIVAYEDSYRYLWVGSQNKGVDVFKITDQRIGPRQKEYSSEGYIAAQYVKCFLEDHLGNIWIGTTNGLIVFKRIGNSYHVFNDPGILPPGKGVFSLVEDKHKTLWIGTHGNGLFTMDLKEFDGRNTEKLRTHRIETLDNFDISQHTVRTMFLDKDDNVWFGTHGDGVYMISSREKNFNRIQTKTLFKNAEDYIQYHGLCYDADGYLWIGTDSDGIYKMKKQGEVVRHYLANGEKGSITDKNILSAMCDHAGNVWFGTYSQGVLLYDKDSDSFVQFPHAVSDAPMTLGNRVSVLFEDSHDNIWVGATRGGLCLIDKKDKTFKLHRAHGMLSKIDVRAIAEDKNGGLWLGCYGNGLGYYHPESNEWDAIFAGTGNDNLLNSNIIYDLAIDKRGQLWIGTNGGGLGSYNTTTKEFKSFTEKDGLINNTIFGLEIDENGEVWASTIKGISRINPITGKILNYTSDDGLQEGQFSQGSSLSNWREGYVCFGGAEGMNLFYPNRLVEEKKIPEVKITGFQLFNSRITVGGSSEDDVLRKVADETRDITLKHHQSSFTFEFTALNFISTKKNKYAYKLEGFDKDWNYVGNQRTASYRYLPAGDYEFKVKATENHDWPETFASMHVTVLPSRWKTPYAYLAYLMLVSFVVIAMVGNRRKQRSLRKRVKTEREKRRREKQLIQEKLSFFTEVSHEFRTPLTLMIGPLEEMLAREQHESPTSRKLKMVNKNAHKLLLLINRLLDYRKVEMGNVILRLHETNIVAFTEEIFVNFRELAHRKNINFEFYTEETSITTWIDKEKMEMVVNNVVSNSFKYIGHGDTISLTIRREKTDGMREVVVMEVKDNGIGIAEDKLHYIFDWFYHGVTNNSVSSGIGLALAKKLVLLHKGEIRVTSTEGKGSVFTIRFPTGKDHFLPQEVVIEETPGDIVERVQPEFHLEDEQEHVNRRRQKGILIVEDDADIRTFLKEYLEVNYRVFEAVNGQEALQAIDVHNPDLIISDVMMPEMNGVDFCRTIKDNIKTSHMPVILLTAKTALSHRKEGLETEADAYITKPFSPEILSLTVNNLLQSREKLKRFYRNLRITGERIEAPNPDEKFLQRLQQLLKDNMSNPDFLLEKYCEEIGMSRSQLYKKIKSLTGQAPVEYIRSLKLVEAANLLKSQQYKVFEVADMVGFSDLKYFRKCFMKEFGYPPSQLIEKHI